MWFSWLKTLSTDPFSVWLWTRFEHMNNEGEIKYIYIIFVEENAFLCGQESPYISLSPLYLF